MFGHIDMATQILYHVYKIQASLFHRWCFVKYRLQKIHKNSLKDQVINAIRDAIIEGKFRPGEKIPELELADQLGVSRTPIREAIHILEQQGLVQIIPKSGTFVAEAEPDEVQDSLETRIVLEDLALQEAIARSTLREWDAFTKKLRRILGDMEKAGEEANNISATELDVEWHTTLINASKNHTLSRVWLATGLQYLIWSPERNLYPISQKEYSEITYRQHKDFYEIILRKDPEEVSQAVRRHILQRYTDFEDQPVATANSEL
jgi:DNA-binding GntR family transcriptional regulator